MQVTRKFCVKQSAALSSVAKNTSCSRGWLRLVIQSIFAVVTTASFILIVLMSVKTPKKPLQPAASRCAVNNCVVVCTKTPYYGLYEDDILSALTLAKTKCTSVNLELNSPYFGNNTLPSHWLSNLRCNIYQLSIIGGNLNYLPSTAFLSQFTLSIRVLLLQELHIKTWGTNSLVGLSSLHTLNIMNCIIEEIQTDSLRAVDNTLETLSITNSGFWNPANVTGSKGLEKLSVVNLSRNQFGNILGRDSFIGLEQCRILYLNSCGIYSIQAGAFDNLKSINVLYLDFNLLVTVPPGLFASLVQIQHPRPRISLQENFWHCDCEMHDLRQLVRKDLLLVEGICSNPISIRGQTFTELENSCVTGELQNNDTNTDINKSRLNYSNNNQIYVTGICQNRNQKMIAKSFNVDSQTNRCFLNRTQIDIVEIENNASLTKENSWVKFNFFLTSSNNNALQIGAWHNINKGLLWYQSDCPYELYCIDFMPSLLRIFNVNSKTQFTFCPIILSTGTIENDACVRYTINDYELPSKTTKSSLLYWTTWTLTALVCVSLGAAIVYGVIRMNPILLKGSKRIVFVKHKTVDALVLPPKIPLRSDFINDTTLDFPDKEIFTLCANDKLKLPKMDRMISIRSNKSGSPSYISALQPSDEQLADWRITRHFNNDLTITSNSESTLSCYRGDTLYYSLESDSTYESLK